MPVSVRSRSVHDATFAALAALVIALFAGPARALVPQTMMSPFGALADGIVSSYDTACQLGVTWFRVDLEVYLIEPSSGSWDWAYMDQQMDRVESRDRNVAPCISVGQCWMSGYAEHGWPSYPPTDLQTTWNPAYGYSQSYYSFIYGVVSHYRGRLEHISIEVEANSQFAGTADEYVRMVKTAHLAAHNADPNILVLDSGLASEAYGATVAQAWISSGLYTDQQILDFANAFFDRDAYYPGLHWTTVASLQNWLSSPFVSDQIQRVNYILDHLGGGIDGLNFKYSVYWWLLQPVIDYIDQRTAAAGYHVDLKICNELSTWNGATETTYAKEAVQQMSECLKLGISRFYWFPISNQIYSTTLMGLVDSLGVVRQLGTAYQYMARVIGTEFAYDHLDLSVPNVRQYVFTHRTDPGHSLRICWYDNATHGAGSTSVRFTLPTNTVRVIKADNLGRRSMAAVAGETYIDITVNETPMFLEIFQQLGATTSVAGATSSPPATPAAASLAQNYPNPFHPTTSIVYTVPGGSGEFRPASLTVFDASGRVVRHLAGGMQAAGVHSAYWSGETDAGESLPPGLYFYRLECGSFHETRKMLLAR